MSGRIIDRAYKKAYNSVFREALRSRQTGFYDECTIPSYSHRNRLVSWLFWKRIETALALAADVRNRTVLDFGCGGCVTFRYLDTCNCKITGCENEFYAFAEEMCKRLGIKADLRMDLFEIDMEFDYIFALDVLEHIEDLGVYIDRFLRLSHDRTRIIVSGPTENLLYRFGRLLIGYSDQGRFHERNIYDVEKTLREKGLRNTASRNLSYPFTLFRISAWSQ